jgi:hypothetical protein
VFDTPTPYVPDVTTIFATPIAMPFPTDDVQLPWEANPVDVATPDIDDLVSGMFMPTNSSCPADVRAIRMDVPSLWYGPFGFNQNQFIMFDTWNFYTWDAMMYNAFTNSYGVSSQVNRVPNEPVNQWLQLPNSFFWVCIDSSGYLYSVYTGS